MPFKLSRSAEPFDPASGLLLTEHFQMAYATNDMERAQDFFSRQLGIKAFRQLEGPGAAGGYVKVALAWVGTIMYELMEATGPGSDIYMDRLPATDAFAIKHHHLGYLIHDEAQWDGMAAQAARNGWAIPYQNRNPLMQVCFVDVPELGHYLEYLWPNQAGLDFFESVPRH